MEGGVWFRALGLFCFLVLFARQISPDIAILSDFYVDIFSIGRSAFRADLFFAYLTAIFFLWDNSRERLWKIISLPKLQKVLLCLTCVLFCLPVVEFLHCSFVYGFSPLATVDFYGSGEISNSSLGNNHFGKIFFAPFLDLFASDSLKYLFDYGGAYLPFVSWPVQIVHVVIGMLFLLAFLLLSPSREVTPQSMRLVSVLASFIVLRNVFDGGVFHTETAVALPIFIFVNSSARASSTLTFLLFLLGGVLLCLSTLFLTFQYVLPKTVVLLFMLLVLFLIDFLVVNKKPIRGFCLGLFFLVFYHLLVFEVQLISPYGKRKVDYAYQQIGRDTEFFVSHRFPIQHETLPVTLLSSEAVGDFWVSRYQSKQAISVMDLVPMGLNIRMKEVDIPGHSCDKDVKAEKKIYIRFGDKDQSFALEGKLASSVEWNLVESSKPYQTLFLRYNACISLGHSLISQVLERNKVDTAVFIWAN